MGWQQIAVALIVAGAVMFLLRRLVGRRQRKGTAETFVPLSQLRRKKPQRPGQDPTCH
jgi:hypothetical protein